MGIISLVIFMTSFLIPLLNFTAIIYLLVPLKFGFRAWKTDVVLRVFHELSPWNLAGVLMLAVLISIVKLLDLATIIPGISLYAFSALIIVSAAASIGKYSWLFWPGTSSDKSLNASGTASHNGLLSCHTCSTLVQPENPIAHHICPHCGSKLHIRKTASIKRTWALVTTAIMLLIPANIYPVMTVIRFGQGAPDTILSGVIHLIQGGSWGIAMVVFFASIIVPFLKLAVLIFLLISVQKKSSWRPRDRTLLYRVTEVIGAWSMVDVFLVGILTSLVNLGTLATIRPGLGVVFFAAAVITTILAAHSFDPRLIWDNSCVKS